jgi:hypothetical protein
LNVDGGRLLNLQPSTFEPSTCSGGAMAYFLAKTEPDGYSIDDLARDG